MSAPAALDSGVTIRPGPAGLGPFGLQRRLGTLFRHDDGRLFLVPLDHSITDGPIGSAERVEDIIHAVARRGADAVVLHKGRLRGLRRPWPRGLGLVVHLSASTACAPDVDAKVLVASVEEALSLGADAVSVHVNIGSRGEAGQLSDLGSVAGACKQWNLPLIAMMYGRGGAIRDSRDPRLIAHLVSVAVDLGADIVKTTYTGSVETMSAVVETSPIPIIIAGGDRLSSVDELLPVLQGALDAGVVGAAVGRNIFRAQDVEDAAARIAALVHGE